MCTVSWTLSGGGYELFFNRDELNTRAPESPPIFAESEGVRFVGPRDGDHQGTWLLTNEWGLTICLLNDYANPWRPLAGAPRFSRGHIVLACAAAASHDAVVSAIRAQPLRCTLPFRLLALSRSEGPLTLHWHGLELTQHKGATLQPPLSSSSFATEEVVAMRTWRFATIVRSPAKAAPKELAAFHRQHQRGAGAHSVLMRRTDAATRSITHVRADESRVELTYEPVQWTAQGPLITTRSQTTLSLRSQTTLAA